MKHKLSIFLLVFSVLCVTIISPLSVQAADEENIISIEQLENGYYYETIIENVAEPRASVPNLPVKSTTKTKTVQMKDSDGTIIWSVSITATFTYDGTSSTCTNCIPSAKAYVSPWSIKSVTSSKSGNSATAKAIATYTGATGNSQNVTKSVTITCSATGVVS